ncbi:hypothetical protein E8E95_00680 [Pseudomonas sp. BN414]|uniref:hypothetical protein n=1 Tax=Pseudomonas sp. BN414 TaxID=2567888 RepID=UPI00245894D7|nr:hypothetical protein [Pseudomonas sp. BN414]MDH4565200.1 hypothetical protein [Pseudomonas sp. BN414]
MNALNLAALESFYVGGALRQVQHRIFGTETQVSGAMYVQRLVPQERHFPFPVIFVHGGMHSGVTWETTPDGREGWQTLFVRAGFETLVIDQAWRGRSAPDLTGLNPFVEEAEPVGSAFTCGLEMGERFARGGGRFPLSQSHCYGAQLWPDFGVPGAIAGGTPGRSDPRALAPLLELIDMLGKVVLITHSQGGHLGWTAALNRPCKVMAIASVEPAQTCPGLDDPEFPEIPVRLIWGDNLPPEGGTLTLRDVAQARALSGQSPNISLDYLPEEGIHGNGHMLMMEDNNDVIAARVIDWLLSTRFE